MQVHLNWSWLNKCDSEMIMLEDVIIQGWPKEISQWPTQIRSYWKFRDELSIVDEVVVKGSHTVLPFKFWPELLTMLHDDSHLGIDRCIQRAKDSVYWPGIFEDIKSIMNKCENAWVMVDIIKKTVHSNRHTNSSLESCSHISICISRLYLYYCCRLIFMLPCCEVT